MTLIRAIKSDLIKTKRTPFIYITILVPVIFPLLMLWYISNYNIDYTFQIRLYSMYFQVIGASLPLISGILAGLNIMSEENAGDFRGFITSPIPRSTIYLSKLIMMILITFIDLFISTGLLLVGLRILYPRVEIQNGLFLQGTLLVGIGSLFLYCLYLMISINFGIGPTISIAVGGTVWGMLLQTGMGDRIWQFVPWAWSGRLGTLPYIILDGMVKYYNSSDNFRNIYKIEMLKGLPIAVISFIIITVIALLWFEKWEGRKVSSD